MLVVVQWFFALEKRTQWFGDDSFKYFRNRRFEGNQTIIVMVGGITAFRNRGNHGKIARGQKGKKFEEKTGKMMKRSKFKDNNVNGDEQNTVRTGWFGNAQRTVLGRSAQC